MDAVLELNMRMYKEEEHELLLDAYSPVKECVLHRKNEMLESLLVRNFFQMQADGQNRSERESGKSSTTLSQQWQGKGG